MKAHVFEREGARFTMIQNPESCQWAQEPECYEMFGVYAESIVAVGRDCTNLRFPSLADHLKKCSICATTIEETLAFLDEISEEVFINEHMCP